MYVCNVCMYLCMYVPKAYLSPACPWTRKKVSLQTSASSFDNFEKGRAALDLQVGFGHGGPMLSSK